MPPFALTLPAADATDATPTEGRHPGDHNELVAALAAIAAEIGAGPRGIFTDLTARLTALDARVGAIDAAAFGAVGDAQLVADVATTNGNATITSASNPWTAADVGKAILLPGAGAAGGTLVTTISVFTAAGSVNVTAAPQATLSNVSVVWGTDDAAAINLAIAAIPTGGGRLYIGGRSLCLSALTSMAGRRNIRIVGQGGRTTDGAGTNPAVMPASALVFAVNSPVTAGDFVTNGTQTITSATANFSANTHVSKPVLGTDMVAGAHIISVTNATTAVLNANATGSGSARSLTIPTSLIDFTRTDNCGIEDVGVYNHHQGFKGILVDFSAPSSALAGSGAFLRRCTIGSLKTGMTGYWSAHFGRTYYARVEHCAFYGADIQIHACNEGSFTNNFLLLGTAFSGHGTTAFRNLAEATAFVGCSFHNNDTATNTVATDNPVNAANGTTIEGGGFFGCWYADANSIAGPRHKLNGSGSASGGLIWAACRNVGGGTSATAFIQFTQNGFKGLTITGCSWTGGRLFDFGTTTGHLSISVTGTNKMGHTDPLYAGTLFPTASGQLHVDEWVGKVKAGTPADTDFTVAPIDGVTAGDSTANKIWIRLGGVWKSVAVA